MEIVAFDSANKNHQKVAHEHLANIEAKFVAQITQQNSVLLALGQKFEKPNVVFGSHKDYTPLQEQEDVNFLSWEPSLPPIKVVLVPDGRIFALNTHRAVAYLMRFGKEVQMQKIPFVLFDFSSIDQPTVVDVNGSARGVQNLQNVYDSAMRLTDRVQNGWRPKDISYTVGQLQKDLLGLANKEIVFE